MPDALLDARFELIDRITDFGLGESWRARDLQVRGRAVVVKLLDAGALRDEALRRARSLRHGAVLPLLHHGAVDGRAYLAYEPFDAPTLSSWLSRVWRGDEAAPRATLERIAERLCEAVDAAHAQTPPLVHGRLSPDCVLVRAIPQGVELRVMDFALGDASRGVAGDLSDLGRTLRALMAAPESRRDGGVAEGLDWRRDDVPDEAWRVALRAMEDRADDRFTDVTAVLEALGVAWRCDAKGPAERPTSPVGLPAKVETKAIVEVAPAMAEVKPVEAAPAEVKPVEVAPAETPTPLAKPVEPIATVTQTRPREEPPREVAAPQAIERPALRGVSSETPAAEAHSRARMIAAAAMAGTLLALVFALTLRALLV